MSKYEANLDLDSSNSLSLMIKNIKKDSVILEFGPANGRLTRYLKESLNCKVYIVEINKSDYDQAINYAEDGFLGDIEQYQWFEKFKLIKFDYILFADVLEHLLKPESAIDHSKQLLADDGKIIASIPNVAHNSIIFNLLKNEFRYNKLGLLDDTHVHLFTYESIKQLFENNNLSIIIEDATYTREQPGEFPHSLNECSQIEEEVLKEHSMGQIYQFIIVAMKREEVDKKSIPFESKISENKEYEYFTLYIDSGNGFSQQEIIQQPIKDGLNNITFNLEKYKNVKSIRLDFGEGFYCIVKLNKVKVNGEIKETEKLVGNFNGNYQGILTFEQTDPYILMDATPDIKNIELSFDFNKVYDNQKLINNYLFQYCQVAPLITLKDNHIKNIECILEQKKELLNIQEDTITEHRKNINDLKNDISELNNTINEKNVNIQQLSRDLKNQDTIIKNQNILLQEKNDLNCKLSQELSEANQKIQTLKRAIKNPFYGLYLLIKRIQRKHD